MWHCPHCGAPQAETARCWVCRKSSTTCSTCRHFQASLTSDVGWCGLDPKRRPLTGREQRGCWELRPATTPAPIPTPMLHSLRSRRRPATDQPDEPTETPHLDFIPVELVGRVVIVTSAEANGDAITGEAAPGLAPRMAPLAGEPEDGWTDRRWTDRTTLFGEPEA